MRACICQTLLDSVFADSEESLPPRVAGEVLVSVEVAVEGIFVYPADLAPEGTPGQGLCEPDSGGFPLCYVHGNEERKLWIPQALYFKSFE